MTEVKMTVKSKPLTKRDVAKFVCGTMAEWGSVLVTDTIIYAYGLPVAKASKHSTFNTVSVVMSTLAISYGVAKTTKKYSDEFVDDLCDCIVMIDDLSKQTAKDKAAAKEEAAHMSTEHMA